MIFGELTIHNFLSIEHAVVQLDEQGVVGVFGLNEDEAGASSNGSGKSSIWDALSWVLYSKTFRQGLGVSDVKRRGRHDGTYVSLSFWDRTKAGWTVSRNRDYKGLPALTLHNGDKDCTGSTPTETQARLDRLVGIPWEVFATTVAFWNEAFRFANGTDKEQKAILDKIVDLTRFDEARKRASAAANSAKAKLAAVQSKKSVADALLAEAIQIRKQAGVLESNFLSTREGLLKTSEAAVVDLSLKIKNLATQRDSEARKTADIFAKIESIRSDVAAHNEARTLLLSLARERDSLKRQLDEASQQATKATSDLNNTASSKRCVACGQTLQSLEATSKAQTMLRDVMEANLKRAASLSTKLKETTDQYAELEAAMSLSEDLSPKMEEYRSQHANASVQVTYIEKQIKVLERELATAEANLNTYMASVCEAAEEMKKRAQEMGDRAAADKSAAAEEENKIINEVALADFWVDGFGPAGIRSLVLDEVVPFLTERANEYSTILTDGSITIQFSTTSELKSGDTRDRFQVRAINSHGADIYAGNSSGEKQRIDVCVALALHDLACRMSQVSANLVVFDETFEHLDTTGIERIMKLLRQNVKRFGSVFVTTHVDGFQSLFGKRLTAVKKDGKTKVLQD